MRTLLPTLACVAALAAPAAPQSSCDSWQALSSIGYVGDSPRITALAADDANGELYAAMRCGCGYHGFSIPEMLRWTGATWLSMFDPSQCDQGEVRGMAVLDPGTGPALYAWGTFTCFPSVTPLVRWNGAAWDNQPSPSQPYCVTVFDDGAGPALYAGNYQGVLRFDGTSWVSVGGTLPTNSVVYQLVVHDDGSGPALYAGGAFTSLGGVSANGVARWSNGAWSALAGGVTGGVGTAAATVTALRSLRDADGPALYAGGGFTQADGAPANGVARWNGAAWAPLGAGLPGTVATVGGLEWFDEGTGLGPQLVVSGYFYTTTYWTGFCQRWDGGAWSSLPAHPGSDTFVGGPLVQLDLPDTAGRDLIGLREVVIGSSRLTQPSRLAACGETGRTFCVGDGSEAPCPCGNDSGSGDRAGCLNSLGLAGALRAGGTPSLSADTLVLTGSGMPNSAALYFQAANQHPAFAFGDGLKCTNGPFVRLRTQVNAGGTSAYPGPSDPPVSVKGLVGAPGTRHYQARYRNAAAFCTPDTFNYTNAVTILWTP